MGPDFRDRMSRLPEKGGGRERKGKRNKNRKRHGVGERTQTSHRALKKFYSWNGCEGGLQLNQGEEGKDK